MPDLIEIQVAPSAIQPAITSAATDLIIPPRRIADRLRHFSEEVYDLSPESHLSRFMKVLLGDAGAGRIRKRMLIQRMRGTLQGSHFYDLDRFYGPLFGLRRSPDEALAVNPYAGVATREQWDDVQARDASFRSRIEQFSRALTFGPTPVGIELIAEALLAVDCEIQEGFIEADTAYQTYQQLQDQFAALVNSEAMASVEADVTDWNAGDANTNISQASDWAFPDGFTAGGGTNSLRLTSVASGAISAESDPVTGVVAGEEYTFGVVAHLETAQDAHVEIDWFTIGPAYDSTSTGGTVAVGVDTATGLFVTATAPAGAVEAVLRIVVEDTDGAAETYEFDRMEFGILNYGEMEEIDYATLEGYGTDVVVGEGRRIFTIRPKRHITLSEAYDLTRVLDKLKPADARYVISTKGINLHAPLTIRDAVADSVHWEIVHKVASTLAETNLPYLNVSVDPVEQPKPPFSGYQGEAWSYITDLAGVTASYIDQAGEVNISPVQRINFFDGTRVDFNVQQSILPARLVQAGRAVSDAIMVAYPYATYTGKSSNKPFDPELQPTDKLYVDGVPVRPLNRKLNTLTRTDPFQQNPEDRYWVSETRYMEEAVEEIVEIRMNRRSWINYVSFEIPKYPQRMTCEIYNSVEGVWTEVLTYDILESTPAFFDPGSEFQLSGGHPHHTFPNHWHRIAEKIEPHFSRRVRIRMQRITGIPPRKRAHKTDRDRINDDSDAIAQPYSLALRSLDVGYRVSGRSDFDFIEEEIIGQTIDPIGSQVQFQVRESSPDLALDGSDVTAWRSEPQVVNYAVVNFYLDTRNEDATDGQVVDRFFIDPTHAGPNFSIYYSNDADGLNLINNPSFDIAGLTPHAQPDPADGVVYGVEKNAAKARTGDKALKIDTTSQVALSKLNFNGLEDLSAAHSEASFGEIYSARYYVKADSAEETNRVKITLDFWSSTGGLLETAGDSGWVEPGTEWAAVGAVTTEAPLGTEWVVASAQVENSGNDGKIIWIEDILMNGPKALTEEFFESRVWTPIPRNYTLQKGYVHIPPTRARYFKFEFTSLVPEQYESFIPITRRTKLFPQKIVRELIFGYGHAEEARLPGMTQAIETAEEIRYRDALTSLRTVDTDSLPPGEYRPTETLWVNNLEEQQRIQDESWQYGFTPWHQAEGQYPRFNKVGRHDYEIAEVRHSQKVGFFVGLRSIEAYRTKYEEDENATVYLDTYDDLRNISLPLGWAAEPGYLHSEGTSPPVVATSRVFFSREPVTRVQFATVQSDPLQLVPDHLFRDPALATYTWDDPDNFQKVGDAQLIYDPVDYSVLNFRYVLPTQKAADPTGGIVQPVVHPVFGYRPFEVEDAAASAATFGGMRTPEAGVSERGRAYAAVRFTMLTDQTTPLVLRVIDTTDGDAVLASKEFTAKKGETVEGYIGYNIPDAVTVVYAEFIQQDKSFDQWKVQALSMFDDAMLWEFSNNGGGDWYPAVEVRNNENGILTFPMPGNQLCYRVTAYRVNRWVSAMKIRPHYVYYSNARPNGTHRGPNVSLYDHDVPIYDDPLFTTWNKPIPYWWFAESRRFPLLAVEGAEFISQFARFYGRPTADDISGLTDAAVGLRTMVRPTEERLDFLSPTLDSVTRSLDITRDIDEDLSGLTDSATAIIIIGEGDPMMAPIPDDL